MAQTKLWDSLLLTKPPTFASGHIRYLFFTVLHENQRADEWTRTAVLLITREPVGTPSILAGLGLKG